MKALLVLFLMVSSLQSYVASAHTKVSYEMTSLEQDVQHAMTSIRNYLTKRPAASDTFEGIACTWIIWESDCNFLATDIALQKLEAEGFVEAIFVGGRIVWRLRRD